MAKTPLDLKQYPAPFTTRTGCKVAWNYYKDEAAAKECAEAAKWNGKVMAGLGYDFGYCSPGSIKKNETGEYAGLFEVCLP